MRQAYLSSMRHVRLQRNQPFNQSVNQSINRFNKCYFSTTTSSSTPNQPVNQSTSQSHRASKKPPLAFGRVAFAVVFATGSMLFFQKLYDLYESGSLTTKSANTHSNDRLINQPINQSIRDGPPRAAKRLADSIGNTPLVLVPSLSKALKRDIYVKLESSNPGGSIKDRAAKFILDDMLAKWQHDRSVNPDYTPARPVIVEATGGNTGIALAMLARQYGFDCMLVYPDIISPMKVKTMRTLGANAIPAPAVPFTSPQHFYHKSHSLADVTPGAYHTEQFENLENWRAHYTTTGPEISAQCEDKIDGFVCASGTGGTLGGVSAYLKNKFPNILTALVDPPNSGMYHWMHTGQFTSRASPTDPGVIEGVGTFRLTANLARGNLDRAFGGSEIEAIRMAHFVKQHDGLFVGASSALNLTGAVKLARQLPEGSKIVTIVMDGGSNYSEKLYNLEWLKSKGLAAFTESNDANDLSWIEDGDARPVKLPAVQRQN